MTDLWNELAKRARRAALSAETMPLGFEAAVLRRLAKTGHENPIEAWLPLLRPALGLAFGTAILCVLLQVRTESPLPANLLADTENLIQLAVLK